jgi:hypothetical protein
MASSPLTFDCRFRPVTAMSLSNRRRTAPPARTAIPPSRHARYVQRTGKSGESVTTKLACRGGR